MLCYMPLSDVHRCQKPVACGGTVTIGLAATVEEHFRCSWIIQLILSTSSHTIDLINCYVTYACCISHLARVVLLDALEGGDKEISPRIARYLAHFRGTARTPRPVLYFSTHSKSRPPIGKPSAFRPRKPRLYYHAGH